MLLKILLGITMAFTVGAFILGTVASIKKNKQFRTLAIIFIVIALVFLVITNKYRDFKFRTEPLRLYEEKVRYEELNDHDKNMVTALILSYNDFKDEEKDEVIKTIIYYNVQRYVASGSSDEEAIELSKQMLESSNIDYSNNLKDFEEALK